MSLTAPAKAAPPELVLGHLCQAIEAGRARVPALREAAATFAVLRASGLTSYFTITLTPTQVALAEGAAPIQWKGRLVTIFLDESELASVVRGGGLQGAQVHGDAALLAELAECLREPLSPVSVRVSR